MWCRTINRFFSMGWVRRVLSTPAAEHQTDIEAFVGRQRTDGTGFLESFGAMGEVAGKRVLDLGCGLGTKAVAVAQAGAAVSVGVDNDVEKIRRARMLADRSDLKSVEFAVQSGTALAFDRDSFDLVLVLDVFEHLNDPAEVLAECARVLRPGGRVLIGFPPYRSPWGGHLFTHVPIPWVHLIFPDREVLDVWRVVHGEAVARGEVRCSVKRARAIIEAESTASLWDCNQMTIAGFLEMVDRAPLKVSSVRYKTLGNLGGSVAERPWFREHLVTRLIAVLEA